MDDCGEVTGQRLPRLCSLMNDINGQTLPFNEMKVDRPL